MRLGGLPPPFCLDSRRQGARYCAHSNAAAIAIFRIDSGHVLVTAPGPRLQFPVLSLLANAALEFKRVGVHG